MSGAYRSWALILTSPIYGGPNLRVYQHSGGIVIKTRGNVMVVPTAAGLASLLVPPYTAPTVSSVHNFPPGIHIVQGAPGG